MSKLDEEIALANAQHAQVCIDSNKEHLEEMERNRIANDLAMRGDPLVAWFKARRQEQKDQNSKHPRTNYPGLESGDASNISPLNLLLGGRNGN